MIKKNDSNKWAFYILGTIAELFTFFHRVNFSVLAPHILRTFKISNSALGMMSSAFFYSYAALQPIVGILTDRWNPKKMLLLFVSIMSLGTLIFSCSPTFSMTFLGRLLIGVGTAGIRVPVSWMITSYFPVEKRGLLFAILVFGGRIGELLATSPFAILINLFKWRNVILYMAFISFGLTFLLWFLSRKSDPKKMEEMPSDCKHVRTEIKQAKEKNNSFFVFKKIFKIPIVIYGVAFLVFLYSPQLSFQGLWAVPFFMDIYHMEEIVASGLLITISLGNMLGLLIMGGFYDTKYGKLIFALSPISTMILFLSLFLWTDKFVGPNIFKIIFFMWGFLQGGAPFVLKVFSLVIPKKYYGTAMGFIQVFPYIGCALYQSFTGLMFDFLEGTNIAIRSVGSYKVFFLFLTLSLIITTFSSFKIVQILNKNYAGRI